MVCKAALYLYCIREKGVGSTMKADVRKMLRYSVLTVVCFIFGWCMWGVLKVEEDVGYNCERVCEAYTHFLASLDRRQAPELAEFLTIGAAAEKVATDADAQELEDAFAALVTNLATGKVCDHYRKHVAQLRPYADPRINLFASDLGHVLQGCPERIDLKPYPKHVRDYYRRWQKILRKGQAYGWKARINDRQRLALIVAAKFYEHLLVAIRNDLYRYAIADAAQSADASEK